VLSDVFAAFFAADNPQVMANALLDCNLCLLKHVTNQEAEEGGDDQGMSAAGADEHGDNDEGFSALEYLKRSSECLATFRAMASPPTFHAAHR
jgi:hypothetical protein